jgi:hypothetical protein
MIYWESQRRLLEIAQKWRAYAEVRRACYLDLYSSGRWRETYTEGQFTPLMREALAGADTWAKITPRTAAPAQPCEPLAGPPYRIAA